MFQCEWPLPAVVLCGQESSGRSAVPLGAFLGPHLESSKLQTEVVDSEHSFRHIPNTGIRRGTAR